MTRPMALLVAPVLALSLLVAGWTPAAGRPAPVDGGQATYSPELLRSESLAGAQDLFADPRVRRWSRRFLEGELDALIESTAQDLRGPAPHPFATHVWFMGMAARGDLREGEATPLPAGLTERQSAEMALAVRIFSLARADRQRDFEELAGEALAMGLTDYWGLLTLTWRTRGETRTAIEARTASLYPDDFGIAFAVSQDASPHLPDPAATGAGHALRRWLLETPRATDFEIRAVTRAWLSHASWDAHALRRLGHSLRATHDHAEALAAYRQADAAYPFIDFLVEYMGGNLAQLRRFDELAAMAAEMAARFHPPRARERIAAGIEMDGLRLAGELGRARARGLAALDAYPDDPRLRLTLARTVMAEDRPQEAIELLLPVVMADAGHRAAFSELASAYLAADRATEAARLSQAFAATGQALAATQIRTWAEALRGLGHHADAAEVGRLVLRQDPRSIWAAGNIGFYLNAAGRPEEAFAHLAELVLAGRFTDWIVARLDDYGRATGQVAALRAVLENAVRAYPHGETLWAKLADMADDPQEVLDRAARAAPRSAFPYILMAQRAQGANSTGWREALDILGHGITALDANGAPPGEISRMLDRRADLLDTAFRLGLTRERHQLEAGLRDLDRARELGLPAQGYWLRRYVMLRRLGPGAEQTRAVLEAAALYEPRAFDDLFRQDVGAHLRLPGYAFVALHDWVERQPRNSRRLLNAASRHSLWGGSPVVALALTQRAERADPNANVSAARGQAIRRLGLHREAYEALYGRASSVADSDRFVGWFETARRRAREPGNTLLSLDLEAMRVVLRRPDGIEEERRFHPRTGRLTHLRVGAAWVAFDFPNGQEVETIRTGGGQEVVLTYENVPLDPMRGRRIVGIRPDAMPAMSFAYGDGERPVRIAVEGVGHIQVTYGPDGGIARTQAFPDVPGEETALALAVTRSFQSLMSLVRLSRGEAGFANLPFSVPELARLRTAHRGGRGGDLATFALAEALLEHRAAHPDHATEFYRLMDGLVDRLLRPTSVRADANHAAAIRAIGLWHAMTREIYPGGLTPSLWRRWVRMRDWVIAQRDGDPAVAQAREALLATIADHPLRALSSAGWLRGSFLSNPGLWRHTRLGSLVPPALARGAAVEAVLIRRNGDLLVGTRRGLSVLRRGFFEWHAFDTAAERLTPSLPYDRVDGASAVQALHEDEDGALWIGTRAGLLRLTGEYGDAPGIWRAGSEGMPEGGVSAIAAFGDGLLVGGPGGLARVHRDAARLETLDARAVLWLRQLNAETVAVGRQDRVELLTREGLQLLAAERLTDVHVHAGRLLAIRGVQVLVAELPLDGPAVFRVLPEQETIAQAGRIFGFSELPILPGETGLGVRTDQGISIYRHGRFEHLTLPGLDRIEPVHHLATRAGRLLAATPNGVALMEEGDAQLVVRGEVRAMIARPDLGMTLVATGRSIMSINHAAPFTRPALLSRTATTALASGPDGAIIANDGAVIVRLARGANGQFERTPLFHASPSNVPRGLAREVRQILVAQDGAIWVIAGPSVFRFQAGAPAADEWSVYLDPERFGANSDMPSRLIETPARELWLVASNEEHRTHAGRPLRGGLFIFDGTGFRPNPLRGNARVFLAGYTPLRDGRGIVGTSSGFAIHAGNELTDLAQSQDASYLALRARLAALHLGTPGIELGDGLLLFGAAGGVVGYRDGTWFYPERLNWMLPGQEHAAYGARAIRQLATDPQGRIYMATDFGVTVYDPRGAGPEAFLIDQGQGGFAFAALESRKMSEVRDILRDALPADSAGGRRLAALHEMRRRLSQLEADLDMGRARGDGAAARLERQVLQLRQRNIAMLADIERNEPELFSLVQVNPLDLQAMRRDLPAGVAILQYLPGRNNLFVHLISRDSQEIRRVDIGAHALEERTRRAVAGLAAQAQGGTVAAEGLGTAGLGSPGLGMGALGAGLSGGLAGGGLGQSPAGGLGLGGGISSPDAPGTTPAEEDRMTGLTGDLAYLYDQLLRPVEHELASFDVVLVAPTGALNYLPFGALVRDVTGAVPHYAVQDFTFGRLPSLYAVQSMLRARPSLALAHLVLGDPDGSLPNARIEAREIAGILAADEVELRLGEEASYDALLEGATQARFLHLAMHGKLDHREPRNSFLLLAGGRRLTLPQIMTLPLEQAELVFLSACETGLGTDGLEHRTIAQAFNHAGVPTVIAAHWEVSDAATRVLAGNFYAERLTQESSARALAQSQRAMIAAGGAFAAPGFWAGFSVFGRP